MPRVFKVQYAEKIRDGMLQWITRISDGPTDWLPGSRGMSLLEAPSIELEELYYQAYRGLMDHLPEVLFDTFAFAALSAKPASGLLTFSADSPAGSDITIPAGTRVGTVGSPTDPARTYVTTAAATLLTGNTSVTGVPAEAEETGPAGNVAAGVIVNILTTITGIDSVTNPAAFSGGRDEETLEDRKSRFILYVATLHRGTRLACRLAAESVIGIASATVVDSPWLYVLVNESDQTGNTPGTFTDVSEAGNDPSDESFAPFPATVQSGDALYIGADIRFDLLRVFLRLPAQYIGSAGVWEYWSDDADELDPCVADPVTEAHGEWLPITNLADESSGLSRSGPVSWSFADMNTWGRSSINGQIGYWIRFRINNPDAITTQAEVHHLVAAPDPGFVYVYAHEGGGTLSNAKRDAVANAVGEVRAAGIKVSVRAPVPKIQDIKAVLLIDRGANRATLRSLATQAIKQFFGRLRIGQALSLEDLSRAVLNTNSQIADLTWLNPPKRDVPASPEILLQLGTLTIE